MNIVRQLRLQKGIQQKELAVQIGVSNATVSDWEHGRKNPSGERLRKLADFFGVEPMTILGSTDIGGTPSNLFVPEDPNESGLSETEQIVQRLLQQLGTQPKTAEARIVSGGMDKMPREQREQILAGVRAMFPNFFEEGDDDETGL